MCGRYALKLPAGALELPFVEESEFPKLELPWEHYNVCPGTQAPILDKGGVLRSALWGLIPHWAKEPPKRPLINARLETAATRASFRQAWTDQRCVVPTSGFYEWSEVDGKRAPYFIPPGGQGESLLWLAGLASYSKDDQRWSYTVLTEDSQGSPVHPYHDRMPVALRDAAAVTAWLQGGGDPGPRAILGDPYRVSPKMNAASVNDPSNLDPLEA